MGVLECSLEEFVMHRLDVSIICTTALVTYVVKQTLELLSSVSRASLAGLAPCEGHTVLIFSGAVGG